MGRDINKLNFEINRPNQAIDPSADQIKISSSSHDFWIFAIHHKVP
jgi:hypothetical protein